MECESTMRDKDNKNRCLVITGESGAARTPHRWSCAAIVAAAITSVSGGCGPDTWPSVRPRGDLSVHQATSTSRPAQTLNLQDAPGASLGKYRMHWPKRARAEVDDRIAQLATVLRQKKVGVVSQLAAGVDFAKLLDDNRLEAAYDERFDILWVRDEALAKGMEMPSSDIGEKRAQLLMKDTFNDLAAAGLIDRRHYDLADIRPSHHHLRAGADDGSVPTQEMVVEYRFRVIRKLNGIDVPNNGILVGIAPSGQRSSIKMGGVQIESAHNGVEERPVQANAVIVRTVANGDIGERCENEISPGHGKHVTWSKLMYVMPEGAAEAVVEPTMVYRFAKTSVGPNGATAIAPATLLSFSLVNSSLPPAKL